MKDLKFELKHLLKEKFIPQSEALGEEQKEYFLATLPLVRSIVAKRFRLTHADSVEDLVQKVAVKLWNWKSGKPDLFLSQTEWKRIANVTAQNEIKRFYSQKFHKETNIAEFNKGDESFFVDDSEKSQVEGNTDTEIVSLVSFLWKVMHELSLRQRFALLFWDKAFIINLLVAGCCTLKELAAFLELDIDTLSEQIKILPLSDDALVALLEKKLNIRVSKRQIWNDRGKAKKKLYEASRRFGVE